MKSPHLPRLKLSGVAGEFSRLLYFCGFAGRFRGPAVPLPTPGLTRVLNSIAAGRRLARRVAAVQVAASLAAALTCLIWGTQAGLGALAGGLAMTAGSGLAGWSAFGGGVAGGGALLGRLLLGTALKWIVVVVVLYLAIAIWRLPAPAVLAGAMTATLAWLAAVRTKTS